MNLWPNLTDILKPLPLPLSRQPSWRLWYETPKQNLRKDQARSGEMETSPVSDEKSK